MKLPFSAIAAFIVACCCAASTYSKAVEARPMSNFIAFVVTHIGAEDRPMPPVVIYDSNAKSAVEKLYPCTQGADCIAIPHANFASLSTRLYTTYFTHLTADKDTEEAGSYSFALRAHGSSQVEIKCNKKHSAAVLKSAIALARSETAKSALERRLAITRL